MAGPLSALLIAIIWLALTRVHELHQRLRIAERHLASMQTNYRALIKAKRRLEGERIYYAGATTFLLFSVSTREMA